MTAALTGREAAALGAATVILAFIHMLCSVAFWLVTGELSMPVESNPWVQLPYTCLANYNRACLKRDDSDDAICAGVAESLENAGVATTVVFVVLALLHALLVWQLWRDNGRHHVRNHFRATEAGIIVMVVVNIAVLIAWTEDSETKAALPCYSLDATGAAIVSGISLAASAVVAVYSLVKENAMFAVSGVAPSGTGVSMSVGGMRVAGLTTHNQTGQPGADVRPQQPQQAQPQHVAAGYPPFSVPPGYSGQPQSLGGAPAPGQQAMPGASSRPRAAMPSSATPTRHRRSA